MVSIDDGDPYTMGLTIAFGDAFSVLGGEVAFTTGIEKGDTDMRDVLAGFVAAVLVTLESRHGTPPNPYWVHACDAIVLLLSAIKSVAVAEGGTLYIDRAALREDLGVISTSSLPSAG